MQMEDIGKILFMLSLFSPSVMSDSCDCMDCSLPGSSVHGILQARILEWVAISFSRGSSQPRGGTGFPALEEEALTFEPPGKPIYKP